MANNSSDPVGNTHTFDAGVSNTEATNNSDNARTAGPEDVSTLTSSYGAPQLDNLQMDWFVGGAVGPDDDLFGEFMYLTPKIRSTVSSRKSVKTPSTARVKSFSRYCDPRELLANPADANIDPSLQASTTDSSRHSDRGSAAGSTEEWHEDNKHWSIPPIGHSFWETFPFQDCMAAIGVRVDTEKTIPDAFGTVPVKHMHPDWDVSAEPETWASPHLTQFERQPFANPAPFSTGENVFGFLQSHQSQPQNQPSQYGEPNYYAAVPGYGAVSDNATQYFGKRPQNFGSFPQNLQQSDSFLLSMPQPIHPGLDQMSFGGAAKVEAWIPSATRWTDGGNMCGFDTTLPDDVAFKHAVVPHEKRRPSANPSTWDAEKSDPEDSPGPRKATKFKLDAKGKKPNARTVAQAKAKAKAQDAYELRKRPERLIIQVSETNKKYTFKYNRFGELDGFYSADELRAYMLHKFPGPRRGPAWMLIQCVPADSGGRYPTKELSDKCRLLNCTSKNRTIAQGTFRVALDEEVSTSRFDPFHTAGFVHLYCLERFFNLGQIAQNCSIAPDTRRLKAFVEGPDHPGRLHLDRTSASNVKTANDFLHALESKRKKASGHDGNPWDYSKTLCWKLTRNATADAKSLRCDNAKKRGGVNMFVHFNNEQRKIDLLERKRTMDKDEFDRKMEEIFDHTILEAQIGLKSKGGDGHCQSSRLPMPKTSSALAQRREETRPTKTRKESGALSSAKSIDFGDLGLRRSPRLSKPSTPVLSCGEKQNSRLSMLLSPALPPPLQTTQSRKRARQHSETDAPGSDDYSPKTLRPTKLTKLNEQPTPMVAPQEQRRLSKPVAPVMTLQQEGQSSPLSPPPVTPTRRLSYVSTLVAPVVTPQEEGQSSPLSPPTMMTLLHSPNVETNKSRKRSRQDSDGSLFGGNSDAESIRSLRPIKRTKYTR